MRDNIKGEYIQQVDAYHFKGDQMAHLIGFIKYPLNIRTVPRTVSNVFFTKRLM